MIGIWQLILILAIVMLLFGAGRISKLMGELGQGIKNLRDGLNGEYKSNDQQKQIKD